MPQLKTSLWIGSYVTQNEHKENPYNFQKLLYWVPFKIQASYLISSVFVSTLFDSVPDKKAYLEFL